MSSIVRIRVRHRQSLIFAAVVLVAAWVVFVEAASVMATESGGVIVGCAQNANGQVRIVDDPSQCLPSEHVVTFAAPQPPPGLEGRIDTLERRVSDLETVTRPQMLTVDCNAGQRVSDALEQVANRLAPVTIKIRGVCTEAVAISQDQITLQGESSGDGLLAPSPSSALLSLHGSQAVQLFRLTLRGGQVGLWADSGATFVANGLDVSGAQLGVFMLSQSVGQIGNSLIHDNFGEGINLLNAAYLGVGGGSGVEGNPRGISSVGSNIQIGSNAVIRNNAEQGINAMHGTHIYVNGATIDGNGVGIFLNWGSTANLSRASVVNNRQEGAIVNGASVLAMTENAIIENNGRGVAAFESATVQINRTSFIRGNSGDGLYLAQTAAFVPGEGAIVANGGWGILCAPQPDVRGIHGRLADAVVSGNGQGQINCPGLVIP